MKRQVHSEVPRGIQREMKSSASRLSYRRIGLLVGLATAAIATHCAHEQKAPPPEQASASQAAVTTPAVDPRADEVLHRMSQYLAKLPAADFEADHSMEVVLKSGEKLNFDGTSKVSFQRPNKLRSDRKGEIADLSLFYDGKTMSIFGRDSNLYATSKAPSNLNEAIDFARERLKIEAPAADLLYSDSYKVLKEDVVSGMYLGKTQIRGVDAHHLAFRGNETDWQIWIADSDTKPVPLKYLITSKKVAEAPEFEVEFRNWETPGKIPDRTFTFVPPRDATRIAFASEAKSK